MAGRYERALAARAAAHSCSDRILRYKWCPDSGSSSGSGIELYRGSTSAEPDLRVWVSQPSQRCDGGLWDHMHALAAPDVRVSLRHLVEGPISKVLLLNVHESG